MDFSAIFAYLTGVRNSKNSGSDLEHSQLLSTGPNTSLVASHVNNIAELSSIFAYFTSVRNRINTDMQRGRSQQLFQGLALIYGH